MTGLGYGQLNRPFNFHISRPIAAGQSKNGQKPVENLGWMQITRSRFETRTHVKTIIHQAPIGVRELRKGETPTTIECQMAEIQVAKKSGLPKR